MAEDQSILNELRELTFLEKLRVLIDANVKQFKWKENGTSILIDLGELDDYLCSVSSVFEVRDRLNFFSALSKLGFERIERKWNKDDSVIIEFMHPFFQRDNIDAMQKFESTVMVLDEKSGALLSSKRNDPCFKPIPLMSGLEEARLRFKLACDKALKQKTIKKMKEANSASTNNVTFDGNAQILALNPGGSDDASSMHVDYHYQLPESESLQAIEMLVDKWVFTSDSDNMINSLDVNELLKNCKLLN